MLTRARNLAVYAVIAALAVGNGFTPRHAKATTDHHASSQSVTTSHHANQSHHPADTSDAPRCHNDEGKDHSRAFSDNNCCVASCSAVAFIFTTIALNRYLTRETYSLPPPRALTSAALIGDDPPPR
jgi:hypothetical protein